MLRFFSTAVTLALFSTLCEAETAFHSLDEIKKTVKQFVTTSQKYDAANSEIVISHLDPRLRLIKCSTPLNAAPLGGYSRSENITITVRCTGKKPWTVHVPVAIRTYVEAVIVTTALMRGTSIKASDIRLERRPLSTLAGGYISNIHKAVGRLPRRTLTRGSVLLPNDFTIAKMVSRGNRVTIIAEGADFAVRMPGRALMDGTRGETIQVQNLSSQRAIEGIVESPGIIRVPM